VIAAPRPESHLRSSTYVETRNSPLWSISIPAGPEMKTPTIRHTCVITTGCQSVNDPVRESIS